MTPIATFCFVSIIGAFSEIGVVAEVMSVWVSEKECAELMLVLELIAVNVGKLLTKCGGYIVVCGEMAGSNSDCTRPMATRVPRL